MIIDIIILVAIVLAAVKGFQRGLIVGLFSFVAVIIGLAAAIKLSAVAAGYIGDTVNISDRWLPVISFLVVLVVVILLVRLGANAIENMVEVVQMGWLNKLGGIVLYVALYLMVLSVLLFYADQLHLFQEETKANSNLFSWIQPWGPRVIGWFGTFIPFFKDMFAELQLFFDNISRQVPPKG